MCFYILADVTNKEEYNYHIGCIKTFHEFTLMFLLNVLTSRHIICKCPIFYFCKFPTTDFTDQHQCTDAMWQYFFCCVTFME